MKTRPQPFRPTALNPALGTAGLTLAVLTTLAANLPAQQQPLLAPLGPQLPGSAAATADLALGDVDGDGDLDIARAQWPQLSLALNDGAGNFTNASAARMPADADNNCRGLTFGDVDGDGDLDLLQAVPDQNRLYLNDGTGTFTDATASHLPVAPWTMQEHVAVGDIDGDGDLDAVFGGSFYHYGQEMQVWVNDGAGRFQDDSLARVPQDSRRVGSLNLGDVDGDGDLDLVCGHRTMSVSSGRPTLGENRVYFNDGRGRFADATSGNWSTPATDTYATVLADFDADGDLDIFCANSGQDRAYRNDGRGRFTDVTVNALPADAHQPGRSGTVAADMDGDGDFDLVVAGRWGAPMRMLLGDGTGHFAEVPTNRLPAQGGNPEAAALADLDGDGDPDLVIVQGSSNNGPLEDRLYRNLQRQLHAPTAPTIGQPYQLDVYARHGQPSLFEVALPCVALAPASIPLPPIGTLGLDPNGLVPLQPVLISPATGVASATIPIPNRPSLVGTDLFGQALVIRYPGQERLTNVTRATLR